MNGEQLNLMSEGTFFGQNNTEIEELVLAAFVNFPDSYYQFSDQISIHEFSTTMSRYIYMAVKEVASVSKIDIATVTDKIIQKKYQDIVGSSKDGYSLVNYLNSICERLDDDSHLKEHIKLLNEYAKRRALLIMSKNIAEQCNDMVSPDEVVGEITKSVVNIQEMGEVEEFDREKKLDGIMERIRKKESPPLISSWFESLDEFMTGWGYGNLVIIAASAGLGKTALALEVFKNCIYKGDKPPFFSLEMTDEELLQRILSAEAQVDGKKIRTMDLGEYEETKLNQVSEKLKGYDFWIDYKSRKLSTVCNQITKYVIRHGSKIVFIDYLQLMIYDGKKTGNRQEEISIITRTLKETAAELDIVIIVLSQLNRAVNSRANNRPVLSDLRESGAIEQDADMVIFIYRESYYNVEAKSEDPTEDVELIIAKGRSVGTGTVDALWTGRYTKFTSFIKSPVTHYAEKQTPDNSQEDMREARLRNSNSEPNNKELFPSDKEVGS